MKTPFDFTAGMTAFIVLCVQSASIIGLLTGDLSFDGYMNAWMPIMTLAIGYWFRGVTSATTP